jgi:hypothetical protein
MGICKLTIKTYNDNTFSTEKGEFITTINPTNLRIYNDVIHSRFNTLGNNNFGIRFNSVQPRTMSFSLLFDNTGVFQNSEEEVKKQLESLESLLIQYQENINEPYYVRVIWGNIDFKGKLSKMTTDYTSFKNDGTPIRAQVDIKILECIQQITNNSSNNEYKSDENDNKNNSNNNNSNKNNNNNKEQAENNIEDENIDNKENKDDNNEEDETSEEDGNNEENENNEEEQNNEENDNNEENNNNEKNENDEENNKSETAQVEVKSKDSLPGVSKTGLSSLGLSGSSLLDAIKNGLCLIGAFNLLDTLRKLAKGFIALIKKLWDLIKSLVKKAIALIKRGATYIKKKVTSKKNNKKENKKENNNKKKSGKSFWQRTKEGFKKVKNTTKNTAKKISNKI